MQSTQIHSLIQRSWPQLVNEYPLIPAIAKAVTMQGGRTFLVGGAVRDLLLGIPVKDIDLEVHGIDARELEALLNQFGTVDYVGKIFGVFKIFSKNGRDFDISLPRTDTAGRKPNVTVDPYMGIKEAFRRRDLTINAMGIDVVTQELIDPFGGYQDLQDRMMRAVDPKFFIEDPLRFYRVMQFIGRFDMDPDNQLNEICKTMDLSELSVERIEKEFEKLFLKSKSPARGIRWLADIGRLNELYPEIAATIGIEQEPEWHPEGDVFEHSMQALDAAARFIYISEYDKLIITYASLCHDLGKATTTTRNEEGRIISYGHAQAGAELVMRLLPRITGKKDLIEAVERLVDCHMQPLQLVAMGAKPSAYKRLARRLSPYANLQLLAHLARADRLARNPNSSHPLDQPEPDVNQFIEKAEQAHVLDQVEPPALQGRDLLDIMEPGPKMGELLKQAYEIQIEENLLDKEELKRRVLEKK